MIIVWSHPTILCSQNVSKTFPTTIRNVPVKRYHNVEMESSPDVHERSPIMFPNGGLWITLPESSQKVTRKPLENVAGGFCVTFTERSMMVFVLYQGSVSWRSRGNTIRTFSCAFWVTFGERPFKVVTSLWGPFSKGVGLTYTGMYVHMYKDRYVSTDMCPFISVHTYMLAQNR